MRKEKPMTTIMEDTRLELAVTKNDLSHLETKVDTLTERVGEALTNMKEITEEAASRVENALATFALDTRNTLEKQGERIGLVEKDVVLLKRIAADFDDIRKWVMSGAIGLIISLGLALWAILQAKGLIQ
jgi:hypothetical protein